MYSREKRKKAIELYNKYDKCAADVNHELGYPDRKTCHRYKWEHCLSFLCQNVFFALSALIHF